jgi:hypothetical protein
VRAFSRSYCESQARSICPTCHRPIQSKQFGIFWPPLKLAILSAIVAAGEIGISSEEILNVAYEGRKRPHPTSIKSHAQQINSILEDEASQWRVISDGGRWVLRRAHGRA